MGNEPPPINSILPVIIERKDHPISRRLIDKDALKVMYRLVNHGYKAYLVGGSVRDLLLGKEPKDFDVTTDARPGEIRKLFRNSRIIGRRFRLAHIYFQGGKIIEVSTFRKSIYVDDEDDENGENDLDDRYDDDENGDGNGNGREKVRPPAENDYGTEVEDAMRRDITINALFYDVKNFSIIDYVGGIEDLKKGIVRSVGCPHRSFSEDPVRIMRVLRHSARTDFAIESDTYAAIPKHLPEISRCPEARLREEFLRDLRGGWAQKCIKLMIETCLLYGLFPAYENVLRGPGAHVFAHYLTSNLKGIDTINNSGGSLSDAMLMTAFLAPFVRHAHIMDHAPTGKGRAGFIHEEVQELIKPLIRAFGFSRGRAERVCQSIFGMLLIEEAARSRGMIPKSLFTKKYFNDGYKLYRIECIGRGETIPKAVRQAAEGLIDRKKKAKEQNGDNDRRHSGNNGSNDRQNSGNNGRRRRNHPRSSNGRRKHAGQNAPSGSK